MSTKERKEWLIEFLDNSELKELEDDIYKGTVETKKSRNEELYNARKEEDGEKRLFLYKAFAKKLINADAKRYAYETIFGLNLDKLRTLKKKNLPKFRQTIYEGFLAHIKKMTQEDFETFVEEVFKKDTTIKEVFPKQKIGTAKKY